jgi:hypothetical protein
MVRFGALSLAASARGHHDKKYRVAASFDRVRTYETSMRAER